MIVGVGRDPVIEQVAVVVPGERHAAHGRQPVGVVVDVGGRAAVRHLRQAVARRIVGVGEKGAVSVIYLLLIVSNSSSNSELSGISAMEWP